MAQFEGTLEEFMTFVGPMTRNIVCNMARSHKKNTTCRHDGCNRRKPLEAAHSKGNERPRIIADILSNFQVEGNLFNVDLEIFKSEFVEAHTPIDKVIIPLCKQHHLEYDKKENIKQEYPILLDEFEDEDGKLIYTNEQLAIIEANELQEIKEELKRSPIESVKAEITEKYNLKSNQIAFSRVSTSNGLWNFDVNKNKFKSDFAFIFYNQEKFKVALIPANSLNVADFPEKDASTIRFFVDNDYVNRNGLDFKKYF